MSKNERAIFWLVATAALSMVLLANDPSLLLASAAEGMLRAIPGCGELLHRAQTAMMGI